MVLRDELVALAVQHVLSCYEMYPNSFLQACIASQIQVPVHITSWIGSGCWALSSYPMQVEASATAIAAKSPGALVGTTAVLLHAPVLSRSLWSCAHVHVPWIRAGHVRRGVTANPRCCRSILRLAGPAVHTGLDSGAHKLTTHAASFMNWLSRSRGRSPSCDRSPRGS